MSSGVHNFIRRHCDQNCKQLFMLCQQAANWWEEAREIQLFMIVLLLLLQATPHHQQTWKSQSYCGGGCARKRLGWENWTIMRLHFLVKIWKGGNKPKLLTLLKKPVGWESVYVTRLFWPENPAHFLVFEKQYSVLGCYCMILSLTHGNDRVSKNRDSTTGIWLL